MIVPNYETTVKDCELLISRLEKENQELKKQLEEKENQQKEFIQYLEKKMNNKAENVFEDGLRWGFQSALSKYKEIIG